MSRIHRYIAAFGLKSSGYLAQFSVLFLCSESLNYAELASYFVYMSINAASSALIDLGFIRYSFRYYAKGVSETVVVNQTLKIVLINLISIQIIVGFPLIWLGYTMAPWMILGASALQLVNVGRSICIASGNIISATLIEVTYSYLYLALCLVVIAVNLDFNIYSALWSAILSQGAALLVSICIGKVPIKSSISEKLRTPFNRSTYNTYKKIIWVGLELALSTLWHQSLVLFAGSTANASLTSILGFFTRIFNIIKGMISVSMSFRMKSYYLSQSFPFVYFGYVIQASTLVVITAIGINLCRWLVVSYVLQINSETISMLLMLSDGWIPISLIFGAFYLNQNLSFVLLGKDLRKSRFIASVIGFVVLFFAAGVLTILNVADYKIWLWAFLFSLLTYHCSMLSTAIRSEKVMA